MNSYDAKRALLGGIIDYAGTFPPAALSLDDALREAATFRKEIQHPWLYSKMALPMTDLKKLSAKYLFERGSDGTPWLFTALGSTVKDDADSAELSRVIEWDLRELRRFNERGNNGPCRYEVIAYEIKLSSAIQNSGSAVRIHDAISPALDRFATLAPFFLYPYLEVSFSGKWKETIEDTVEAISQWMESNQGYRLTPGIKVRTGGKEVPTSEQLAAVIALVTSTGLRFKATQGLHSAVTHKGSFGFVNLFSALTLSQALGGEAFGKAKIKQLLETEEKNEFRMGTQSFSWKEHELDLESIESARRHHGGCFGSCSLKEPDDSLKETF